MKHPRLTKSPAHFQLQSPPPLAHPPRAAAGRRRAIATATVVGTALALQAPACGQSAPTEIVLQVYTDLPCPAEAAVAAGIAGELGDRVPSAVSTTCDPETGSLGQLVIVPRTDVAAEVALEVRLRTDHRPPDECLASKNYDGCIVARRILNYIPGRVVRMRVDLKNPCVDTPCDQDTSCVAQGLSKSCVEARVDASQCVGVCAEDDLIEQHQGTFTPCGAATNPCGENASCVLDDDGAALCICPSGWSLDPTSQACVDIDECDLGTHDCDEHATCTNTEGSFECTCETGYSGDGKTCTSQCPVTCAAQASCRDVAGELRCVCNDGFSGDGATCSDINECSRGTHDCIAPATCENTPGSFTCNCPSGYEPQGRNACVDIDECNLGVDDCAPEATCENTPGSFTCNCPSGYEPQGHNACVDVDECNLGIDDCAPESNCENTPGGYECICPPHLVENNGGCYPANLALAATASASSTFENYSPAHVNDGSNSTTFGPSHGWTNSSGGSPPQWWQITWDREVLFERIELYGPTQYVVRDYDLQYFSGGNWHVIEEVTGNIANHRTHTFSTVTTSALRIVGYTGNENTHFIHLNEVEVYRH